MLIQNHDEVFEDGECTKVLNHAERKINVNAIMCNTTLIYIFFYKRHLNSIFRIGHTCLYSVSSNDLHCYFQVSSCSAVISLPT